MDRTNSTLDDDLAGLQSADNDIDDEDLLDVGGSAAILMGIHSYRTGNPSRGTKLVGLGLAAIGGRRVLQNYFQN